jgi:hypothetical protein
MQLIPALPVSFESKTSQSAVLVSPAVQTVTSEDGYGSPLDHARQKDRQLVVTATPRNVQLLTIAYAVFICAKKCFESQRRSKG